MILIAKIYLGLVFEMLLMLPWFILLQNIDNDTLQSCNTSVSMILNHFFVALVHQPM